MVVPEILLYRCYYVSLGRHVDGHDYMWAVSEMIDKADECIFILVWGEFFSSDRTLNRLQ